MGGGGGGQFTGIGQGAPINFNNDELESELLDLLGENEPKQARTPKKAAGKQMVAWNDLDNMVNACMEDVDDEDEDIDDPDLEGRV